VEARRFDRNEAKNRRKSGTIQLMVELLHRHKLVESVTIVRKASTDRVESLVHRRLAELQHRRDELLRKHVTLYPRSAAL
jgi:hypothetical protein